ncbi:PadR family transcriptional regulator [Actinomadura sp. ATCC 31491]|uniref:PadR family transcriptional regulator n=1 Tax=Actinomadura luzonensis TaxID=2805427 RepID=A0ABT0G3A2_9ACTN|nr:PadR family transcriptional regulator [Actinomadura luzonensis]MCK2218608.1 PadR family transcriptional regulator [Actinomadura luzonensis]
MSIGHVLLGLLAERPKHGYELKKEHDQRLAGARPLPYGQVYATLQRLERDGLAEVAGTSQEGGPERTVYAITDGGRAELERWLNAVEPPAPYVAGSLFARVAVAGKAADGYLVRQREAHLARMRELTAEKAAGAPAQVLAADYALQHLDADLRWIETALARMREDDHA